MDRSHTWDMCILETYRRNAYTCVSLELFSKQGRIDMNCLSWETKGCDRRGDCDDLERELEALVERADAWLAPLLGQPQMMAALEAVRAHRADATNGPTSPALCVLADARLQLLPLEAVPAIARIGCSLSRDFSVHLLAGRRKASSSSSSSKDAASDELVFENSDVCFVADPRREDAGSACVERPRLTILESFARLRRKADPKLGAAAAAAAVTTTPASEWLEGVCGSSEHIACCAEIQELLQSRASARGGFVFYGAGRLASHLPPTHLAGLSLDALRVVLLVDRCDNEQSYRRQSKLDTQKTSGELRLEEPLEQAALWSLAGAGAVLLNQWPASFHANRQLLERLLESLSKGGGNTTLGDALCFATDARTPLQNARDASMSESSKSSSSSSSSHKQTTQDSSNSRPKTPKSKDGGRPKTPKSKDGTAKLNADASSASTAHADANAPHTPTFALKTRVRYNPLIFGLPLFKLKD